VTIDERLEKLAVRHEALTPTVEILTRDMIDLQKAMKETQKFVTEVAEGTARLLHVAQIHEHRITGLEGDAD
jgi:archaellum component FlaC